MTVIGVLILSLLLEQGQAFVPVGHHDLAARPSIIALEAVSSTAIRPVVVQQDAHNVHSNASMSCRGRRNNKSCPSQQEDDDSSSDDLLQDLGLPFGLRQVLLQSLDLYKKRIWIIDNSGSMTLQDGHQMVLPLAPPPSSSSSQAATAAEHEDNKNNSTTTPIISSSGCSRWMEAKETVTCHAMLAGTLQAPTEFRLLNAPSRGGPQQFRVGHGHKQTALRDCKRVQQGLQRSSPPTGGTPLAQALRRVQQEVVQMLPELHEADQKVAIVLLTDGCTHDKSNVGTHLVEAQRNAEILEAMQSLQGLPVTVVVRLCTDYGPVTHFYHAIDDCLSEGRFGLDLDVLDDFEAEAEAVHAQNPWLTYALPLHRIREMGQDDALFDVLNERPLTRLEIKQFCTLLFGVPEWPTDWLHFLQAVHAVQEMERLQVNPMTNALAPWIDVRQLFVIGCYWDEKHH